MINHYIRSRKKSHDMKHRFVHIIFFLCMAVSGMKAACRPSFTVPFEMVGSYVVVSVRVNDSNPLKLILDSGVRSTIITELLSGDSITLNYSSTRELMGLGSRSSLQAYVSDSNMLSMGRKMKMTNRTIYVLQEDIFNLSKQTGSKINGLLGADFFQDYIVQIDYTGRRIRFYEKDNFCVPKGYGVMPMTIERQKMYIHLSVLETESSRRRIKMLIDTGAELGAWFQTLTNNAVNIPEKSVRGRIGEGLSGEISGYYARVPQICIANFCVRNPIVAFPDSATIASIVRNSDRDGTIGSQLLSRFNLIIDTFNEKFYFKPNNTFTRPFAYNVAGIEIAQSASLIPQVEVVNVWEGSPAAKAGVKPGDVITEINYNRIFGLTLTQIRAFFETPSRHPLPIQLQRHSQVIDLKIEMKSKI